MKRYGGHNSHLGTLTNTSHEFSLVALMNTEGEFLQVYDNRWNVGYFLISERDNIVTDIIYLKKYPLSIFMLYLYQTQLVLYKEV